MNVEELQQAISTVLQQHEDVDQGVHDARNEQKVTWTRWPSWEYDTCNMSVNRDPVRPACWQHDMIRAAIRRHVKPTVHLIIVQWQLNQDLDKGISTVVRNNGERSERAKRGMDGSHHYRASVTWVVSWTWKDWDSQLADEEVYYLHKGHHTNIGHEQRFGPPAADVVLSAYYIYSVIVIFCSNITTRFYQILHFTTLH